jgi:hypothetical protein
VSKSCGRVWVPNQLLLGTVPVRGDQTRIAAQQIRSAQTSKIAPAAPSEAAKERAASLKGGGVAFAGGFGRSVFRLDVSAGPEVSFCVNGANAHLTA